MKYFCFSMIFLALTSCKLTDSGEVKSADNTETQVTPESPERYASTECNTVLSPPENFEELEYNNTQIQTARILRDELHLTFGYSGCQEGQPYLAILGDASGKKATIIRLKLKMHEAGMCEMYLQDSACFNLNTIDSYGSEWEIHINEKTILNYRP